MTADNDPEFGRLTLASLSRALAHGWFVFLKTRQLSVSYAMVFAPIGILILVSIVRASFAPMIFPLAGAFILLGPALLTGFFALADQLALRETCAFSDVVVALSRTSRAMLLVALLTTVLFMIWVVDVAALYGLFVGRVPMSMLAFLSTAQNALSFLIWTSVGGAALALGIFSISAFSVPLLYYRRVGAVRAIVVSVRAVFNNLLICVVWALVLTVSITVSLLVFPLFLLTFPVLAFASHALYRELFPEPTV